MPCSSLLVASLLAALPAPSVRAQEPSPVAAPPGLEAARLQLAGLRRRWLERGEIGFAPGADALGLQICFDLLADQRERVAECAADGELLLDLASLGLDAQPTPELRAGPSELERVRRLAFEALTSWVVGPDREAAAAWLARILVDRRAPLGRRAQALELVDRARPAAGRNALLTAARDPLDPLRPAMLDVLALWPDEAVDSFLVSLIAHAFDEKGPTQPFTVLLKRVREVHQPLGRRATEDLCPRLATMLIATDWRQAARAIELTRGLAPAYGVPLLLDALAVWTKRETLGGGSRRILDDVLRELRRRSGRSIGRSHLSWTTWWIAVRQGRVALAGEASASRPSDPPDEARTEATFFGLRPLTDQVTFVIDLSGSMSTGWGTTGHSRYVEAVEQMMRFLQAAGERTRFDVVLFNGGVLRSNDKLVPATARNLDRARRALLELVPAGDTCLRPAIEAALGLSGESAGRPLEADTIIVLCDGETSEGPSWVAPLLERVRDASQVRFHCVLIGTQGDGTLEALAEGTGGDFLRN